uniref:GCN5-like N-acetyltransferase n=1 Tax=Erythrolobus coxiae TaxID=362235 RepID=UPI001FCE0D22|nr:GCN5-like N-acetyltransferase [Erythrolobus coxiae]UNJ17684.1 GCN5-like N-acetyltransferase [Erythrolobus coxiae]
MLFWKNFFNKNDTIGTSVKSNQKSINQILIKQLNSLNIYITSDPIIDIGTLETICDSVGWVKRPPNRIQKAIRNSFLLVTLFYVQSNEKQIIGFARVTSDHVFNATVWDVVIDPKFHGYGLGKLLMSYVVQQLRTLDISTITLFADSDVTKFYKKLGFIADPNNVKGMFWYPK